LGYATGREGPGDSMAVTGEQHEEFGKR